MMVNGLYTGKASAQLLVKLNSEGMYVVDCDELDMDYMVLLYCDAYEC